ncbi:MAG TPA: SpoIIE family protein phosphatase [Balneolaceae bacterium]
MISEEAHIVYGETPMVEWVAAALAKEGEQECADLFLVKPDENGVLLAAVDGLGHGPEAQQVSRKVVKCLESGTANQSLIALIEGCHEEIKGSRGAVISIARINSSNGELSWLSVGNIEGVLVKNSRNGQQFKELVLRSGVVGYTLPSLQVSVEKISAGDVLFFATDGVMNEFIEGLNYNTPMKKTVKYAAKNYFKKTDDSLILAARLKRS